MMYDRVNLNGFAADLGGTKIACGRIADGEVVARRQVETNGAASADEQVQVILEQLETLGYRPGLPLGVAVAGRLDREGFWHAVNGQILSEVSAFPLREALEGKANGVVTCCNDAAAAAIAEAHFGAGIGSEKFVYLTVSTGIGGALVLDGKLVKSSNGLAGHVGFASSPLAHGRCGSGRDNTVESIASGRAMALEAERLGHAGLNARDIFELAPTRVWAKEIIACSEKAIAVLIADLTSILGIDRVAIGGGIGLAQGYIENVGSALLAEPVLFRPCLTWAKLGQDGVLLGALAMRNEKGPSAVPSG